MANKQFKMGDKVIIQSPDFGNNSEWFKNSAYENFGRFMDEHGYLYVFTVNEHGVAFLTTDNPLEQYITETCAVHTEVLRLHQ